MTAETGNY